MNKAGHCIHVRRAKTDCAHRAAGSTPQAQLADLVVELSRKVVHDKCTSAAAALRPMLTAMARIADSNSGCYEVEPLKEHVSTRPERGTGENQRGVRRNESVLRACSEGVMLSRAARSGHETARAVHNMDGREVGTLENQTTTQYRVCSKRKFAEAFGPWGSQNDGARLGNPAANTDIYIVQNYKMQRAAVLPNQAFCFLPNNELHKPLA